MWVILRNRQFGGYLVATISSRQGVIVRTAGLLTALTVYLNLDLLWDMASAVQILWLWGGWSLPQTVSVTFPLTLWKYGAPVDVLWIRLDGACGHVRVCSVYSTMSRVLDSTYWLSIKWILYKTSVSTSKSSYLVKTVAVKDIYTEKPLSDHS